MNGIFTRLEADAYRNLKSLSVDLGPYQVLVGPNASGKSNFLDVIGFLSDLLAVGVRSAASNRSENFHDLVWGREGSCFSLVVEAEIPKGYRAPSRSDTYGTIRYEVRVKVDTVLDEVLLDREQLTLKSPELDDVLVLEGQDGYVKYRAEEGDYTLSFALSPTMSGLSILPLDAEFPASKWLRGILLNGVQIVILNSERLHASSPPRQTKGNARLFDGSDLPHRISRLTDLYPEQFKKWIRHIQTALPDIETVKTILRPEDKHRYLMVRYKNGIEVPAWTLSDGTLRLLALTSIAYVPGKERVHLVEEPEIGVYPSAFEIIVQSLSSVYNGQVFITTHAPLLVGLSRPEDLLCFSKTDQGTQVTRGDHHPLLQSWQAESELSDLFAAGVLG